MICHSLQCSTLIDILRREKAEGPPIQFPTQVDSERLLEPAKYPERKHDETSCVSYENPCSVLKIQQGNYLLEIDQGRLMKQIYGIARASQIDRTSEPQDAGNRVLTGDQ